VSSSARPALLPTHRPVRSRDARNRALRRAAQSRAAAPALAVASISKISRVASRPARHGSPPRMFARAMSADVAQRAVGGMK
jgi:hypothetical protein